jgi:hypothetical protein
VANRSVVTHAECGALIAAVPIMLRFVPTDSLIVVGFNGTGLLRATFGMRVDLPAPAEYSAVLGVLRGAISRQAPDAVAVIVVGGDHRDADDDDLPHRALVRGCTALAEDLGLPLLSSLWVAAIEAHQAWFSYAEPGRFGTVPDPRTSAVGLEAVVGGAVTYDSRETFTAQLSPDPADDLRRRAEIIRHLPRVIVEDAAALVRDALDHVIEPDFRVDDEQIARVGHGLTHPRVRDVAVALAVTGAAGASELLWSRLTRATPRPFVTHPATLLALVTYLRGNGVLAGVALDIALDADPSNMLAALIRACLHQGVAPQQIEQLLTTATSAASVKAT